MEGGREGGDACHRLGRADTGATREPRARISGPYCEETVSMVLAHVHVHHLQQVSHLFEVHPAVVVFVCFLEPVADPSEREA